ncbi:hypothetical protein JCGZ_00477 [Jatropha curcas]|uniref:Glycosyltransferase n=1 Tax=Jatropha curcas TaxID=180498 RepID=A0A067L6F1_JATCU|nr:anthocyanidin 3-O-glucosyltransferase 6 [Jatropha curcas]KDP42778.1 hypothetical protein JCGZ_00477 [Jatropha curcas]
MKKVELVFVPSPGVGHLASTLKAANLLLGRHERISITVFVIKLSSDLKIAKYIDSLPTSDRIRFIHLRPNDDSNDSPLTFIEKYKPHIKEAVSKLTANSDSSLAGFVLDMFCAPVIDVANEFGVPSYIFYTSSAASLGFWLYVQFIHDEQHVDLTQFKDSNTELVVPTSVNSVPGRVFPSSFFEKERLVPLLAHGRRFRESKGIMVNSFMELESHAFNYFGHSESSKTPPVYPVGPILGLEGDVVSDGSIGDKEIMKWLDDQAPESVVFLCFGSGGGFPEDQVKEIACALEHTGYRFLWSLRQLPPKGKMGPPSDYEDLAQVLPTGFLDRTDGIGKIIGWAPQTAILGHPAIGGFVSHCGWNSILESLWFGVPIATWPMYAEQQFNAFAMVIELGLAVEIKMDYKKDSEIIVSAKDIEKGIKCLMEHDNEVRMKVKEMSENSRKALSDGGSSSFSLDRLIQDIINNVI